MAILSSGCWAVYNTRTKKCVGGIDAVTNRIFTTDEPGLVQYFETKESAETAMKYAKCGKSYKAVKVKLMPIRE